MKLDQHDFEALFKRECTQGALTLVASPGNAGDNLITVSTLSSMKKLGLNADVVLPGDSSRQDLHKRTLLIGGGGNLIPLYDDVRNLIDRFMHACQQLVVMPHTIAGHEDLLQKLPSNSIVFCREQTTFQHVSEASSSRSYLCDDIVFYGDLNGLRDRRLPLTLLRDLLAVAGVKGFSRKRYLQAKIHLLRTWCRRKLAHAPLSGHLYRTDAESASDDRPADNCDASVIFGYGQTSIEQIRESARDFVNYIDQFDIVYTDRLHVCITAARLGKTVYFSGGSYHKCRSVYENSIAGRFDNVIWT